MQDVDQANDSQSEGPTGHKKQVRVKSPHAPKERHHNGRTIMGYRKTEHVIPKNGQIGLQRDFSAQ
jgi:hypothetical protein